LRAQLADYEEMGKAIARFIARIFASVTILQQFHDQRIGNLRLLAIGAYDLLKA
jgi:hypothetical protein